MLPLDSFSMGGQNVIDIEAPSYMHSESFGKGNGHLRKSLEHWSCSAHKHNLKVVHCRLRLHRHGSIEIDTTRGHVANT